MGTVCNRLNGQYEDRIIECQSWMLRQIERKYIAPLHRKFIDQLLR